MFNKLLYDRNAYNRIVNLSSLSSTIPSYGDINLKLVIVSPIEIDAIKAKSSMTCSLVMKQHISSNIVGDSVLNIDDFILRLVIQLNSILGNGNVIPKLSVKTPFTPELYGTSSASIDDRLLMIQHMNGSIKASGVLDPGLVIQTAMYIDIEGTSHIKDEMTLALPLNLGINGDGDLKLRRLSALSENILELANISLMPGESVTIDTDLLQVLFGATEDVSAVTSDSVFFELNPGENEITVSTDSNSKIDVVTIWQNRWL